jgi:hypothetical protein
MGAHSLRSQDARALRAHQEALRPAGEFLLDMGLNEAIAAEIKAQGVRPLLQEPSRPGAREPAPSCLTETAGP